jgi:hypothetical protein
MRLLLADADSDDTSVGPHPIAAQIIDLAIGRPELFIALLFEVRVRPKLLVDLLIHPATSGVACLLIAQWSSPVGAWERSLIEHDNQLGKNEVFTDAVAILGEYVRTGKTSAAEAGALLNWLHGQASRSFIDDVASADSLISTLRREFTNFPSSILLAMAQSLYGPELRLGLGASEFAAVIDLSDLGGIENEVDADTIVTAYAHSIAIGAYSLSAHRMGVTGAAALAQIASRTQELRRCFLYPFDIQARFVSATPQDNEFLLADSIGRSLRTHIRVLCRAIIGGAPDISEDLFDALVAAVRSGALQHKERGRIAAFAPRFETDIAWSAVDRPLAADLAAALTVAEQQRQQILLGVILETDEPTILAQLLSRSPPNLRSDIAKRIAKIAPTDAATIHSLTDMQARIDELLTAGATDAAASYIAAERTLRTYGKPAGRELDRFKNQLRLNYLREDWAAISATAYPQFSEPQEQASAVETLQQFHGLAAIMGPKPNLNQAKALFRTLFERRPSLGFATNWFAAEIRDLLHSDSFGILKGQELRRGREAIEAVEKMLTQLPGSSVDETMECNRALLYLALGKPSQVLAVLSNVTLNRLRDTAAAYRAIALARLGRRSEATATLDGAEYTFGSSPVLTAARSHIANGEHFLSFPDASVYESLVENVASAIARFRIMDPVTQAGVLQRQPDPFGALLIDYVRAAADALVSFVPLTKAFHTALNEDGLTAFIQRFLAARVDFLGWSVADQSRGGYSAKGNAGERDLVIAWGSSILTIIEAIMCDKPLSRDAMKADLESHFQRLLGYGTVRVFFYLIYAYIEDKTGLMDLLIASANAARPTGFTYLGYDRIPHQDSRPPGFIARYEGDFGEVKVVFLVLDLGQQRQLEASRLGGATKKRRAPPKPKSSTQTKQNDPH